MRVEGSEHHLSITPIKPCDLGVCHEMFCETDRKTESENDSHFWQLLWFPELGHLSIPVHPGTLSTSYSVWLKMFLMNYEKLPI